MNSSYLKRIFLPGIILQSVLIGGGYATGREIVEYGAKYGANGWVCGLMIFFGFSLMAMLSMEASRIWKVYDYKSLLSKMVGRAWVLYEIAYLLGAVLIIAVMASAAGAILQSTMGFEPWVGVLIIVLLVGFLNYKGEDVIAKLETIGTNPLFAAYFIFAFVVYQQRSDQMWSVFHRGDVSFLPSSTPSLLWTGILYVGYNLGVYPAAMFTYRDVQSRQESVVAGFISGLLMTIPWFITYFAIMGYYPDGAILSSSVPWLEILKSFHPALIIVFGIVVGWTLVETATGMIHAFISRIEVDLEERKKAKMSKLTRASIAIVALVASLILAQVGIIDLVAKGYEALAYVLILFFAVPMLLYSKKLLID